jgi:hypothetical protein
VPTDGAATVALEVLGAGVGAVETLGTEGVGAADGVEGWGFAHAAAITAITDNATSPLGITPHPSAAA